MTTYTYEDLGIKDYSLSEVLEKLKRMPPTYVIQGMNASDAIKYKITFDTEMKPRQLGANNV